MSRNRRLLGIGVLILTSVAAVSACSTPDTETDSELSLTISGTLGNFMNPFDGGIVSELAVHAVYETLISKTADEEFKPLLAESYEISDDRLSITMNLREDVDFIDGTHLDAAGVVEYLTAIFADPDYVEIPVLIDRYHTTFDAVGEYAIEFTTTAQIGPEWLVAIGETAIVSPEALDDLDALTFDPVGTGPYVIASREPDVSISFVRNDEYWNPEGFDFDTITIRTFDDDVAALNALKSGQIDVAPVKQLELASEAEASGLQVFKGVGSFPGLYFIDREGLIQPAFADLRVRQAINLAFDRESINEALNLGLGSVTSQAFVEGEAPYVEGEDDFYGYDVARAKELLAEAGYPDGFDLTIPMTVSHSQTFGPILQQSLADIGIRLTIETIQDDDALKLITEGWSSGKYPVAAFTFPFGGLASKIYWIENFFGGYHDATAEEMVNGWRVGDAAAAKAFGEYVLEQAWFVRISSPPSIYVARDGIDVHMPATDFGPTLADVTATG